MNTNTPSMDFAQIAADCWNAGADEYNQWDALGQDEKDELISAEKNAGRRLEGRPFLRIENQGFINDDQS